MPLDESLLKFVRRQGQRLIAQCPACAEVGRDQDGRNHPVLSADDRFGCVAHPGDREHRQRILAIAGDRRRRHLDLDLPLHRLIRFTQT